MAPTAQRGTAAFKAWMIGISFTDAQAECLITTNGISEAGHLKHLSINLSNQLFKYTGLTDVPFIARCKLNAMALWVINENRKGTSMATLNISLFNAATLDEYMTRLNQPESDNKHLKDVSCPKPWK